MVKKTTVITSIILLIIVAGIGYCVYRANSDGSDAPVEYLSNGHWHAQIEITLCGEHKDLPLALPGQGHRGLPYLHSHDDNKMHMEVANQIVKKSDLSLGKFMDAMGVPFSSTQIMDRKNGDLCTNTTTPGSVKMFVNNQPNTQFKDYVPNLVADEFMDKIRIEFG